MLKKILVLMISMLFVSCLMKKGSENKMQIMKNVPSEKIVFDLSADDARVFYLSDLAHPVFDVKAGLAVGPSGEISILEPDVGRIRGFNPEGKLLSTLTLDRICGTLGMINKRTDMNIANIFSSGKYLASALVHQESTKDLVNQYWLVKYKVDTAQIAGLYKVPQLSRGTDWVNMSFLDKGGYLWLYTNKWLIYGPNGNLAAVLEQDASYVDTNGLLYVISDKVQMIDREGRIVAKLKVEQGADVDIDGGDSEAFLFFWDRREENVHIHSREIDTYRNVVVLYQVRSEIQRLDLIGRFELKPTKLIYPLSNPEIAVPIETYIKELAVVRGKYLYVLAYSEDRYWVDRYDFSPWCVP